MAQETAADSIEKLELQAAQSRWGDSTPAEGDPAGSGRCNLHTGCSHAILLGRGGIGEREGREKSLSTVLSDYDK